MNKFALSLLALLASGQAVALNGSQVVPNTISPWVVKLEVSTAQDLVKSCHGVVVDDNWLLTTGDCVADKFGNPYQADQIKVKYGGDILQEIVVEEDTDDTDDGDDTVDLGGDLYPSASSSLNVAIDRSVTDVFFHPAYLPGEGRNNQALLKISNMVFPSSVVLVGTAEEQQSLQQSLEQLAVAGGPQPPALYVTSFGTGNYLKQLWLDVSAESECVESSGVYFSQGYCTRATLSQPSSSICNGDSGAPVVFKNHEVQETDDFGVRLAGLVFSASCSNEPSLVYQVDLSWINSEIGTFHDITYDQHHDNSPEYRSDPFHLTPTGRPPLSDVGSSDSGGTGSIVGLFILALLAGSREFLKGRSRV